MKETYLKHITVIGIIVGAILLTALGHMTGDDTKMLFAFILGYVFKNGYTAVKKVNENGKIQSRRL